MSDNHTVVTRDASTVDTHGMTAVREANRQVTVKGKGDVHDDSHSSRSSCGERTRTRLVKSNIAKLCLQLVGGLIAVTVAGIVQALLAASIFLRSTRMTGTLGVYGSVSAAIGIILVTIFGFYVVYLYVSYRYCHKESFDGTGQQHEDEDSAEDQQGESEVYEDDGKTTTCHVDVEQGDCEVPSATTSPSPSSSTSSSSTTMVAASSKNNDKRVSFGASASRRLRRFCVRYLLPLTLILFVGTEAALLLNIPRNAILPLFPPFAEDALSAQGVYRPRDCDLTDRWQNAKDFFRHHKSLDVTKVKLVYGGMTFSPNAVASEFDNTVYFWKYTCPSEDTLVHELTHVVQEQTGYWSGVGAPRRGWDLLVVDCHSCQYDFTYDDLQAQMELALAGDARAANIYRAFNPEQGAEIVEDYYLNYYRCKQSADKGTTDEQYEETPWYCEALRYYATQLTGGD